MRTRFHLTPTRLAVLSCIVVAIVLGWWVWPVSRAYYLADTGTWPEKTHFVREADCLYDVLRTRPFSETGPAIVRGLAERFPTSGYHNSREGEHSWRFRKLSSAERAYYLAEVLWREASSPPLRPEFTSALPALLRTATSSSQRRMVIHTLAYAWNPEALTDLLRIASDPNEDLETQAAAVSVLMRRDDNHRHVLAAIEIIRRGETTKLTRRPLSAELPPIQRKLYLFQAIISGAQVELLPPGDRAQLVQVGMSLLRELPETDLRSGYFVAGLLGRMVNAPDNFAPNQRDYRIKNGGGGLKDTFFTDTVKNALAWQETNTPLTRLP
ncbi:MAG TPA: hypothetical protein VK968_07050 [Roseimicrobium sp.]|nr:hypothetical protein [Roseimicrobium sp.]